MWWAPYGLQPRSGSTDARVASKEMFHFHFFCWNTDMAVMADAQVPEWLRRKCYTSIFFWDREGLFWCNTDVAVMVEMWDKTKLNRLSPPNTDKQQSCKNRKFFGKKLCHFVHCSTVTVLVVLAHIFYIKAHSRQQKMAHALRSWKYQTNRPPTHISIFLHQKCLISATKMLQLKNAGKQLLFGVKNENEK